MPAWFSKRKDVEFASSASDTVFPAHSDPVPAVFSFDHWPFDNALCLLDEAGNILRTSANFADLVGAKPGGLLLPLIAAESRKNFLAALEDWKGRKNFAPLSIRLQGMARRFVELRPIAAPEGLLLTLSDVTPVIEKERELTRATINTELALRARSEFLGRMSHELRTPLNAVIGFAQMIESRIGGPLDHPLYEEYLRSIMESGEHLLEKINNLVAISEAELGGIEPAENECDVAFLLKQASEHHQHYAFSKDVQLNIACAEGEYRIKGDSTLLIKALSCLIENALAASRPNGAVRLECRRAPDDSLAIRVVDNGIGLSDNLIKCLRSFFEGNLQMNSHYDQLPLGTGLILTREYLLLHQGRLEVESKKGGGSAFAMRLPAARFMASPVGMPQAIAV